MVIFWIAKKQVFGAQNGQNHSGGKARERQKIDKSAALRLRWCCPVFEGASGHVFGRFSVGFGMDLACFSERFRGTSFAKKLAIDRLPHPQKSFSEHIFGTPWAHNLQ